MIVTGVGVVGAGGAGPVARGRAQPGGAGAIPGATARMARKSSSVSAGPQGAISEKACV